MQKNLSCKAHGASPASDDQGAVNVQSRAPAPASRTRQARRKSLAAFILAIPPGDPSDERDFARIQ